MHIYIYLVKDILSRCLKHTLNITMSDYIGTNLKSKIIKILNLFLSISDSNNGKDDNIEKKKKRKKKKSEKEI